MHVYTWHHTHYLMRQCDGVGGWGKERLKYRLCKVQVQNQRSDEGRDWHLHPPWPSGSPNPFSPLPPLLSWPLSGSNIRSVLSSYLALLRPPLPHNCLGDSPQLPAASDPLPLPKLHRMCIRCWAAISSSNTSPWPKRMFIVTNISLSFFAGFRDNRDSHGWIIQADLWGGKRKYSGLM